MHGLIYPQGAPLTDCWFQVISEEDLQFWGWSWHDGLGQPFLTGELVPCAETPEEIGSSGAGVPVHAVINGLHPAPYAYRLGAANEYEERWYSEPALIGPVRVETLGADPIRASEATVHGHLFKQYSGEATYWVEYGIRNLKERTSVGWLSALGYDYDLEATLPCLQPDSNYTYRFAGMNAAGTVHGLEGRFQLSWTNL